MIANLAMVKNLVFGLMLHKCPSYIINHMNYELTYDWYEQIGISTQWIA